MGPRKKDSTRSKQKSRVEELWFVLDCPEDDSVCLVSEPSVQFGEDVERGDIVKFYMTPGSKKRLDGTVVDFSVDYDAMLQKQQDRNSEKKKLAKAKENSFHEDRARKCSSVHRRKIVQGSKGPIKERSEGTSATKRKKDENKSSSESDSEHRTSADQIDISDDDSLHELLNSKGRKKDKLDVDDIFCDNHDADDFESVSTNSMSKGNDAHTDSSDSDLTPDQIELMLKLQRKMARKDSNLLRGLLPSSSQQNRSTNKEQRTNSSVQPKRKVQESVLSTELLQNSDDDDGLGCEGVETTKPPSSFAKPKQSVSKKKPKVEIERKKFTGNMFNQKAPENPLDTSFVKLHKHHDVYVKVADLEVAKAKSQTPTAYARKLLSLVFTAEARLECSITGGPSCGKGKLAADTRPSLDENGINAILLAVKLRCKKKLAVGFPLFPGESVIRQKLAGKLCEERAALASLKKKETNDNTEV